MMMLMMVMMVMLVMMVMMLMRVIMLVMYLACHCMRCRLPKTPLVATDSAPATQLLYHHQHLTKAQKQAKKKTQGCDTYSFFGHVKVG